MAMALEQPASWEEPARDIDELLALRASVLSLAQRSTPACARSSWRTLSRPPPSPATPSAPSRPRWPRPSRTPRLSNPVRTLGRLLRLSDLGTSVQHARDLLETAEALQSLPATEAAARRGELSGDQAQAVTKGASADPESEGRLVETARRACLGELKDEARAVRFGPEPDPEAEKDLRAALAAHKVAGAPGNGVAGPQELGKRTPGVGSTADGAGEGDGGRETAESWESESAKSQRKPSSKVRTTKRWTRGGAVT